MVLLSKILLILLLPILSVFPSAISEKTEDFKVKVNDYYDSYVLETYETDNFTFMLAEGVCNSELAYGVYLASLEANSYDIKIYLNSVEYKLEEDSRGDVVCPVVKRLDGEIKVCVYDNLNGNSTKRYESILKFNTKEALEMNVNCVKGNNLGTKEIFELDVNREIRNSIVTLVIILSSISGVCVLWILYLFITKKGLFDKAKEHVSEVDFFVYEEDERVNNPYIRDDANEAEVISEENVYDNQNNEQKDIYEKKYYYEEDLEDFDFTPYLAEKGLGNDYSVMSEEEKNSVMILLMTLKHKGTINEVQYKNEVIKLWKK